MNLVLLSATGLGLKCLNLVQSIAGVVVSGVVTAPKRFKISYRPEGVENVLFGDLATEASRLSIPCYVMKKDMAEAGIMDFVRTCEPEAFLAAGWYHMIPASWRKMAPALGIHFSLLPDYAGGAPLVWAIIEGKSEAGVSLFRMDDGVDTGDILGKKAFPIDFNDTIATVYPKAEAAGLQLLEAHLPELRDGRAQWSQQDLTTRRQMPQRSPGDGKIDWQQPARKIYDFVRAQTKPYPGAYTSWKGRTIKIWKASLVQEGNAYSAKPGEVVELRKQGVVVGCGVDGEVIMIELVGDGDQELPAREFALVEHISPGERI